MTLVFLPQQPLLNCPYFSRTQEYSASTTQGELKMENGKINPLQKRPPQTTTMSRMRTHHHHLRHHLRLVRVRRQTHQTLRLVRVRRLFQTYVFAVLII